MPRPRSSSPRFPRGAVAAAVSVVALGALTPAPASAHFVLEAPASWRAQDAYGSPQKLAPCGDDGNAMQTGAVTTFQAGQTITITIDEKIYHPGHYYVALAVHDRSELPPEPIVTPGASACGSVPISSQPVFPFLADGLLVHTSAFNGPQTMQVTLPSNVTCDHCTLQVVEFMSNHPLNNPGGCFYHHCADIAIQGAAGAGAGGNGGSDAGASGAAATGGSGTSATGGSGAAATGGSGTAATGGSATAGSGSAGKSASGGNGAGASGGKQGASGVGGAAVATGGSSDPGAAAPASSSGGCAIQPQTSGRAPTLYAGLIALGVLLRRRRARS